MKSVACVGVVGVVLLLGASVAAQQDDARRAEKIAAMNAAREEALAVLKRASDFLGQQQSFRYEADVGYEALQPSGIKIEFGARRAVTVRRPHHVRVDVEARDGDRKVLRFDGRLFTAFFPDENAYAQVERPGTLDETIDYLVDDLGVPLPLSDFVHSDFYADVHEGIEMALIVGEATIDGKPCDHLLLVGSTADFQVWIEKGATPFPRRLVITYREAPATPYFQASLHEWNLAPDTSDALFAFSPPEGAERLQTRAVTTEGSE